MKKTVKKLTALVLSLLLVFSTCLAVSADDGAGAAPSGVTVEKIDFNNDDFIKGMDVSSVIALENSGVTFKNENGDEEDLFKILSDNGVNYIRVRVWNDPFTEGGACYGGGNNDVSTAAIIGARAAEYGMKLLVDFHYSDFWADPSKQKAPKAWADMDVDQKATALNRFTASALSDIKNAGADIGMVQIGNETNNGIAGETTFSDMVKLFNAGASAVRDFDENIRVALHFADPQDANALEWNASALEVNDVDYDVFAVSYYPCWHGSLTNLTNVLNNISKTYDKEVMVAETSYAYTLDDSDGFQNTVNANSNSDVQDCIWGYSPQGQASEVHDVMNAVNNVEDGKGIGVFYWEGAWITVGDTRYLSDTEYDEGVRNNSVLWETYGSGWAASAAGSYDKDAEQYYGGSAVDNQAFFDPSGKALPSLKVFNLVDGSGQENTEPTETGDTENTEATEVTEDTEVTEATEITEATEATEVTEATENTEATEVTEDTEATENTEATQATENTEATEQTEATEPTEEPKPTLEHDSVWFDAGETFKITVLNAGNNTIKYKSSDTKTALVSDKGVVTGVKKGTAKVTVTVGASTLNFTAHVISNPSLKVNGKDYKATTTYSVQSGKSLSVKISGKVSSIKNVYSTSNKSIAKVTSATTATTVSIKGSWQGTATVTIKVNGVAYKIKVKVYYRSYKLKGMDVGGVQPDGGILFKIQKDIPSNGRALNFLLNDNTKRKIVLPKKTIKIERVLHIGSNKTIIATGATIFQTDRKKNMMDNHCTKTNYNSLKNLSITGGTWQIKDNAKALNDTSTFRFAHAQNIKIKNARVDTNYISHAIEIIACKNVTMYNCKFESKGKQKNDIFAEPVQIDISTKATAPQIAKYGKKYVQGQICKNITVEKCIVKGSRGICTNKTDKEGGKWLKKHHVNVKIIGCTVTGTRTQALCLHNVKGVVVKNNKLYSKGNISSNNYNSGCLFESCGYDASTANYKNVFSGNIIKGGKFGLRIKTKFGNKHGVTTITNNKLYAKGGKSNALSVENCKKVIKKKNKLYGKW